MSLVDQTRPRDAIPPILEDANLDLIWGAESIGRFIGKSRRATFHLLIKGMLPAEKVGDQWVSSRKRLRDRLVGQS
jgi:hypothetical protein